MPDIKVGPGTINFTGWHGDKYNHVFNRKNSATGAPENITGIYKVFVRKKGATTNAVELTGAPDITINGSQLVVKMDRILALSPDSYDIQMILVDGTVDRVIGAGNCIIKQRL